MKALIPLVFVCCVLSSMVSAGLRADINGDGRVDLFDFQILAEEWLMESSMYYPEKITVSGSITPSWPVGKVMEQLSPPWGPIGGLPAWGTDGYPVEPAVNLSWDTDHWFLYYSPSPSGPDIYAWIRYDPDPIGEYIPSGDSLGNAFVESLDDYYNVYAGQDGVIDYETVVATMTLEDTQVTIPSMDLPANTVWHFVRRLVRGDGCGLEGPSSDPCIVYIDAAGDMQPAEPNAPADLTATPQAGGKIKLRWIYSAAGQEAPPAHFQVYLDGVPTDTVTYNGGLTYEWTSEALTHGQAYDFLVTAVATGGGESQNDDTVSATADDQGPAAITGLSITSEEE